MNTKSILGLAILPLFLMVGCAADTEEETGGDDEAVAETQDELVAKNYCSAGTWNSVPLRVTMKLDGDPRFVWFYFEGVRYRVQNNAYVTLVHPDGKWVKFATPDSIVDRQWTRAPLRQVATSGGIVSGAVGPGTVYRVQAIFDIPNAPDKACSTFLAW